MAHLVSLVTSGVLARHPNLKLVINEVGLGWLPFLVERFDHFYPYLRDEFPDFDRPPGDYLRRQVYLSTHPLPPGAASARAAIDFLGADHVLFGSDYPHFDAAVPSALDSLGLSDKARTQILSGTAREIFRL